MVRPGFVVDGYQKYVGMGLVHRSMKEMLSGKKDGFQACSIASRVEAIASRLECLLSAVLCLPLSVCHWSVLLTSRE